MIILRIFGKIYKLSLSSSIMKISISSLVKVEEFEGRDILPPLYQSPDLIVPGPNPDPDNLTQFIYDSVPFGPFGFYQLGRNGTNIFLYHARIFNRQGYGNEDIFAPTLYRKVENLDGDELEVSSILLGSSGTNNQDYLKLNKHLNNRALLNPSSVPNAALDLEQVIEQLQPSQ